jgi:hypothetical protein
MYKPIQYGYTCYFTVCVCVYIYIYMCVYIYTDIGIFPATTCVARQVRSGPVIRTLLNPNLSSYCSDCDVWQDLFMCVCKRAYCDKRALNWQMLVLLYCVMCSACIRPGYSYWVGITYFNDTSLWKWRDGSGLRWKHWINETDPNCDSSIVGNLTIARTMYDSQWEICTEWESEVYTTHLICELDRSSDNYGKS